MGMEASTNQFGDAVALPLSSFAEDGLLDLAFSAEDLQQLNTTFWEDGVVPGDFSNMGITSDTNAKVTFMQGLEVAVAPGRVHIDGTVNFWKNTIQLSVEYPDAADRIDSVVVRRDLSARTTTIYIKRGTQSLTPSPPTLIYNKGGIAEFRLSNIYVQAAITTLAAEDITDTRVFIRAKSTSSQWPPLSMLVLPCALSDNDALGWTPQGGQISYALNPQLYKRLEAEYNESAYIPEIITVSGAGAAPVTITVHGHPSTASGFKMVTTTNRGPVDQLYNLTGNAFWFIWDQTNKVFYLPRFSDAFTYTNDISKIGQYAPGIRLDTSLGIDSGGIALGRSVKLFVYFRTGDRVINGDDIDFGGIWNAINNLQTQFPVIVENLISNRMISAGPFIFKADGKITAPSWAHRAIINACAGGGGGAGVSSNNSFPFNTSGGAGGAAVNHVIDITPNTEYAITIGKGGAGLAYGSSVGVNAESGGDTSFGNLLTLTGGGGGRRGLSESDYYRYGGLRGEGPYGLPYRQIVPAAIFAVASPFGMSGPFGNGGHFVSSGVAIADADGNGAGGGAGSTLATGSYNGSAGSSGFLMVQWLPATTTAY